MSLLADVQGYSPGSLINLFEIDFTTMGIPNPPVSMYLYPGLKENYGDVVFDGNTYAPWPFEISDLKKSSEGPLPRPIMSISNVTGFISQQLLTYNDYIGAKVKMYTTFAKYLDGEPGADPTARTTEIFFVEQKKTENPSVVQLVLVSAIDIMDASLPSRNMLTNTCLWLYRGSECGWNISTSGRLFDANDNPVVDLADDVCGKRLESCKKRFCKYLNGDYVKPNESLPYGAFPALGVSK